MNDAIETLKEVIKIFEGGASAHVAMYEAQDYIFEKHPELEEQE